MSFTSSIDVFDSPEVEQGTPLIVKGWVADVRVGAEARSIIAIVDNTWRYRAATMQRPDVAQHLGNPKLERCGFGVAIPSGDFTIGNHMLSIVAEDDLGERQTIYQGNFRTVIPVEKKTRIVLAAAPKSGSSYTSSVLQRYFNVSEPDPVGTHMLWEHNIDPSVAEQLRGRSYLMQRHMRPYEPNLEFIRREGISVIVTWRNLGDVVVSLDDHFRREPRGPLFLAHLREDRYFALEQQERYRFVIRFIIPWYVHFYLGWKEAGAPFFDYRVLAEDEYRYLASVVSHIAGNVDESRLRKVIDASESLGKPRINVGREGRSLEYLSSASQALLEDLLRSNVEPLDELVAELPWNH